MPRIPMVDYLVVDADEPHLVAHTCTACAARYLERRNGCGRCGGRTFERSDLNRHGRLRTFSIVHRAPGLKEPYVAGVVDLDGGGVVRTNIVGVRPHPAEVRCGMPVRLVTFVAGIDDEGTEAVAFAFEPRAEGDARG